MSPDSLQARLAALQETTTQLRQLIDRLATLDFQTPRWVDEEPSTGDELAAEIGQMLRTGVDEQELLSEEIKFVRPEGAEKAALRDGIERLGAELSRCRARFRKARLVARENLTQARRAEWLSLVRSYAPPGGPEEPTTPPAHESPRAAAAAAAAAARHPRRPQNLGPPSQQQPSALSERDQQAVGASSNVTGALRRTHDLIAAELHRSEYAHQTLAESSAALRQLGESYTSLDSMLASSRDLLGTLLRSQKSDTWYLQTALYVLVVTGAWLLFRRLLYGPLWWFAWLPLRLLLGVGYKAGGAVVRQSVPGTSGKSAVGRGSEAAAAAAAVVEGLPGEELPTVLVGKQQGRLADDADPAVGKAAEIGGDAGEDAAEAADENARQDEPRNPKKRMWEEPEVGGASQQRDEL
ncbi:uncharacterized protein UV8b_01928 [Ustilaginoidea virens]|uniref:Sec20 C-terminal domain-containing protein n=1 Tax=Ustilaginoidea virens TaxID=1159556 RepID=A0A8E5MFD9_USTVR|nr:uncharacterized protein UV8b_01928 [Ustilaginoidea virens]QUC17687.1 hypothetical protein UV8b_01928 [Ustilaginoidea virens]